MVSITGKHKWHSDDTALNAQNLLLSDHQSVSYLDTSVDRWYIIKTLFQFRPSSCPSDLNVYRTPYQTKNKCSLVEAINHHWNSRLLQVLLLSQLVLLMVSYLSHIEWTAMARRWRTICGLSNPLIDSSSVSFFLSLLFLLGYLAALKKTWKL